MSAPFVNVGSYLIKTEKDGSITDSRHFKANGKSTLTGSESFADFEFGGFPIPGFTVERRSYYAFDISQITDNITSATFRFWAWGGDVPIGIFSSQDACETLALKSVDNHTANQVLNAPFNDKNNHATDVPIWEDLGDGTGYGSRVLTAADRSSPGLIPNPLSITTDCSDTNSQYCGRWLDIDLTAALADLNSETDVFIFGASVADISGASGGVDKVEQITAAIYDLSGNNFDTPKPQLLLETTVVPVPATLWLFGSGMVGLMGAVRQQKLLTRHP